VPFLYFAEPIGERNPKYDQNPAYRSDHTYKVLFTASEKGPMTFFAPPGGSPTDGQTYSGSYTVTVTREADDESLWEVPFKVRQRGEPHAGNGEGKSFAAAETIGSGKLIFTRQPKARATGSVAAHLTHSDDFLEADLTSYGQTATLVPAAGTDGTYVRPHAGVRILHFPFTVSKVAFDGPRRDPDPLTVGNRGVIIVQDSEDRGDRLVISFTDDHGHRSETDRKDTVKVTIGKPRKVGGATPAR
jgi:hypothetical protein